MNILLTGDWTDAKKFTSELESLGHAVQFMQNQNDQLPCDYSWPEAVVCSHLFEYHSIDKFEDLKFIQCVMAGIEHLPLDYIREHNIELRNASGVYSIPIAEYVVGGILQIYKDSIGYYKKQTAHTWEKNRNLLELTNKRIYILGTGSIGCEIAKHLKAFDCNIIGFNRSQNKSNYFDEVHSISEFAKLAQHADIIISALPLDNSTYHLINNDVLSSLNQNAVLVNVSRGAIINSEALASNISNIKGAVLDVFEDEPLPETHPLWNAPNVIITPHNSFVGDQNNQRLNALIMSNLKGL